MSAHPESTKAGVVAEALCRYRAPLAAFVRARVRPSDADDVLQTAALRAIERADSLHDPDRVLAWLYRVHRNVMTDMARKQASNARLAKNAAMEVEQPESNDDPSCRCSLTQAQRLTPNYESILGLVDLGEASLREAAQVLGVTVNTATVRLHRARRALKKRMVEHCGVTQFSDCLDCRCVHEGCCAA